MLRRYWHRLRRGPGCSKVARTKEVKILARARRLHRDRSGKLGIVDKYCTIVANSLTPTASVDRWHPLLVPRLEV